MNSTFRLALLAAAIAGSFSAHATNLFGDTVNNNQTYNQPQGGQGGQGGAGGSGGSAAALAVSSAAAQANAAAVAAQQQAQLQGQTQQQQQSNRSNNENNNSNVSRNNNTANGVNTSNNSNNNTTGNSTAGSGNSTVLNYERSAPSTSATAPVYVRNCRIGIGAGGSNANGSFTAAIPLGNDATCLAGAALEAMQIAGGFSVRSKQTVACTIEGMEVLPECKKLKEEVKAEAILEGKQQVAGMNLLP